MVEPMILNFEEKSLRVVTLDGNRWWVGKDACVALNIRNHRDALKRLGEDRKKSVQLPDAYGRMQPTSIIDLPGLSHLIFTSHSPAAKAFYHWVVCDAMPLLMFTAIAPQISTCPVEQIEIGDRHRKDMGNLDELAKSISELGLLHPIVVTTDSHLVAGARRLAAVKQLGWRDVPVTVVDLPSILRGEHDENVYRKDFTPSEMVDLGRALEVEASLQAAERQREGQRAGGRGHKKNFLYQLILAVNLQLEV